MKIKLFSREDFERIVFIHKLTLPEWLFNILIAFFPIIFYIFFAILSNSNDKNTGNSLEIHILDAFKEMASKGELLAITFAISTPLLYLLFKGLKKNENELTIYRLLAFLISVLAISLYGVFVILRERGNLSNAFILPVSYFSLLIVSVLFYRALYITNIDKKQLAEAGVRSLDRQQEKMSDDLDGRI
ncbi:hypothetical protein [Deinococcus ruber]|uniref:DUF2919 domain-containing protein n=1 Tax=Deinococcus ruber TaxID=1848197 RepID=A0A918C9C3_9DEIO|nr:hypothetical protein [Deinococcus ruber]GGR11699.1 hypothetical protein GCM10008957_25900 [Deinococcus ruber]